MVIVVLSLCSRDTERKQEAAYVGTHFLPFQVPECGSEEHPCSVPVLQAMLI